MYIVHLLADIFCLIFSIDKSSDVFVTFFLKENILIKTVSQYLLLFIL